MTFSSRRSTDHKVPPRIGGCHFLLCQHTNTKDIAGQSAICLVTFIDGFMEAKLMVASTRQPGEYNTICVQKMKWQSFAKKPDPCFHSRSFSSARNFSEQIFSWQHLHLSSASMSSKERSTMLSSSAHCLFFTFRKEDKNQNENGHMI